MVLKKCFVCVNCQARNKKSAVSNATELADNVMTSWKCTHSI
uniref:Uncharacterized protein n=1 Tax=Anguilla anguilla TaxID=7936 RepID=A0A0E9XFQ3_ANGAN